MPFFYLHKTGCQWRSLPHDFPPGPVVFYYFKKWRNKGTWAQVNQMLTQNAEKLRDAIPTDRCHT